MGVLVLAREDGLNPKRVAATKGGEYHSPCPACGGKDRFIIWDKLNRYMCRQCKKRGDEVQYRRDFHGLSFLEACQKSGIAPKDKMLPKRALSPFSFLPRIAKIPPGAWRKEAEAFTRYCHEQLKKDHFALDLFHKRGFSNATIDRFHLGWNPTSLWLERSQWGLEEGKKLWIPKGLVIPTHDLATKDLIRLKIRRSDWHEEDTLPKYVEISGSMPVPSVYGDPKNKLLMIVEAELDAILLHQCAGDLCCSMALGGASKRPDAEAHKLLLNASRIIFSLDVDSAGAKAYRWWKDVYPNLKLYPPPAGKSPGDAFIAGIDLRRWVGVVLD